MLLRAYNAGRHLVQHPRCRHTAGQILIVDDGEIIERRARESLLADNSF
jgi:hypothetical protein